MSRRRSLDVRGPVRISAIALLALACAGWAALDGMRPAGGFALADIRAVAHEPQAVRHPGGRIARVLVTAGQRVSAGDLLAILESGDIDAAITALRAEAETTRLMLDSVGRETKAFQAMLDQGLVTRDKVAALEARAAELERRSAQVLEQITEAGRRLKEVEIRAPVAGVVGSVDGLAAGRVVAAGERLAEIVPDALRPMVEARVPVDLLHAISPARELTLWPGTRAWLVLTPRTARVVWVAPAPDGVGAEASHIVRLEIEPGPAGSPALADTSLAGARIVLPRADRPLWQQLIDPLRRVAGNHAPA
jgi:hypothetical protein